MNVTRHDNLVTSMRSGSVPHQQYFFFAMLGRKIFEKFTDIFRIQKRLNRIVNMSVKRTNRCIGVHIFSDNSLWNYWSHRIWSPTCTWFHKPTKSSFILKHYPQRTGGNQQVTGLPNLFGESFFLKAIWANLSSSGWRGSGSNLRHRCRSKSRVMVLGGTSFPTLCSNASWREATITNSPALAFSMKGDKNSASSSILKKEFRRPPQSSRAEFIPEAVFWNSFRRRQTVRALTPMSSAASSIEHRFLLTNKTAKHFRIWYTSETSLTCFRADLAYRSVALRFFGIHKIYYTAILNAN